MLTPEDLDRAGELVSAAYVQVESEMLDYLVRRMLEGDVSGQRAQTAILLLAQSARPQLEAILAEHADEIDGAVQREVEGALMRSDAADLDYIRQGLGVELPALTTRQTAATCAGVAEILQRHNLDMVQAAQDAFVRCSAEAMVQVNTGAMTTERALHRAVRRLEAEGIAMVDYVDPGTGRATVSNHVDVAVRRHVRTQIAQAGERLTEQRMDEAGVEFVEVSSHSGARESHRAWEGRVYSRHGDRTVDGVRYRDFHAACNYGDVADGIYGANCRHSHGPYIPGMPRAYGPDPKHPSGLPNDEVYELTQEQRRRERGIREAKRELRGAQLAYEKDPSPANLAEANRAKQKLRNRQEAMRGFIDEANGRCRPGTAVLQRSPRREWAGDMPKGAAPKASGRSIDELLAMSSTKRKLEAAGMSKTAAGKALRAELRAQGVDPAHARFVSREYIADELDIVLSSSARRLETRTKAAGAERNVKIASDEAKAILENVHLKEKLGGKRLADIAAATEEAIRSGSPSRVNAARAFSRAVDSGMVRIDKADTWYNPAKRKHELVDASFFDPNSRRVIVAKDKDMPTRTAVHEALHAADFQQQVSYGLGNVQTSARKFNSIAFTDGNGYIKTHMAEDWASIEAKAASRGIAPKYVLEQKIRAVGLDPNSYDDVGFFSDMVDAASNGALHFNGSHSGEPGYWQQYGGHMTSVESLADYGGAAVANPVEYELMRDVFPHTTGILDQLLEAMANAQVNQ